MLKSMSSRSNNRIDSDLTNSHDSSPSSSASSRRHNSMPIFRNSHRMRKKERSLILNQAEFELCSAPDENEMLEFVRNSSNDNIHQSESTIADNTLVEQQQQEQARPLCHNSSMTPSRNCSTSMHRTISHLKNKLVAHRHGRTNSEGDDHEKNLGFLLVEQVDSDPVFVPSEENDPQYTRHAEPCMPVPLTNEDNIDLAQIQLLSTTPITPSLDPPPPPSISFLTPLQNGVDVQATQAGVQCGVPLPGVVVHTEFDPTQTNSSTNSSNSSTFESPYDGIDRSLLDDNEYVRAQESDLEQLTMFEIKLRNEFRDLQCDLSQSDADELDFNRRYDEAIKQNAMLKMLLQQIEEENARVNQKWSCNSCTYINQPFSVTGRDVCEICEAPSPLKRATLTS